MFFNNPMIKGDEHISRRKYFKRATHVQPQLRINIRTIFSRSILFYKPNLLYKMIILYSATSTSNEQPEFNLE